MKYTAQVIYPQFAEIFDVTLSDNNLDIQLANLAQESVERKGILSLDLSKEVKDDYSVFPYEDGDLIIVQSKNCFFIGSKVEGELNWYRFGSTQLIEYLFIHNVTNHIFPYMKEDKDILLNGLLCDFVRNDFSYNKLNKKIKFLKVAVLLDFITKNITKDYHRIIFDETVLGDVEIGDIPLSLRFSQGTIIRAAKVNNVMKVMTLLHMTKKVDHEPRFLEDVFFVNTPNNGEKVKFIFGESGVKFDYQVLPLKNYVFDLGGKDYTLNIGNSIKETVRGKVYVYNGDERDLMIQDE